MTTIVRSRARKQPAEIRREEVLDAAVRVFARESFRGAGTAEIAREAGIAEPTIYRHFGSKRELYLAALQRCCDVVGSSFQQFQDEHDDALDALMAMVEWYDHAIRENPAYLLLRMRAEGETNDLDVRQQLAAAYTGLVENVAALVRRGQAQGVFRTQAPPNGAAWLFMGMGQVADLTLMLGLEDDAARECFEDLGRLFWDVIVEPAEMPRVWARVQEWGAHQA